MKLNLKKPLVFLDIEATGLHHTKDRIVEVGLLRLQPDGAEERRSWRVNPEIPIPEKISDIIGINNEDVKDRPVFKSVGGEILNFIGTADLAGYNPFRLDLPLLMEEFMRAGYDFDISRRKIIDVQRIFFMFEKRDLHAAYMFYCGKNLNGHHGAMADTEATSEILMAQLERYEGLGNEVSHICDATGNPVENIVDIVGRIVKDENGEEVFNFGKYKGEKVAEVLRRDPSYYTWMMNGDFTAYTKKKLTELRLKMKNNS